MSTSLITSKTFESNLNNFTPDNGDKFTLSKVTKIITNKKSLDNSNKMVTYLSNKIDKLPVKQIPYYKIDSFKIENIELNIKRIDTFINTITKIEVDVILDSMDMCIILDNMKKSKEMLEYIKEYLSYAINVSKEVNESKNIEPVSFESLISKLNSKCIG